MQKVVVAPKPTTSRESCFRSEVLPAGGRVPEAAPSPGGEIRAAASCRRILLSSWFPPQEILGLGCSTMAIITGRETGGSVCLSPPAVTKLHQHPWAGP